MNISPFIFLAATGVIVAAAADAANTSDRLVNLAPSAVASTPHAPQRSTRGAGKAIDGVAGRDPNNGWMPSIAGGASAEHPVLLALTWPEPVALSKIVIKWPEKRGWYFSSYTIARWDAGTLPDLGAPATIFPHVDVFIGGQDGYDTYRIPALVVSNKGTVLAFCEARKNNARDHGDIDLMIKRSVDGGKTWGPMRCVYGEPGDVTIGNPVPIVDRLTGEIHLVFSRDGTTLFYTKSMDDGVTFARPIDITGVIRRFAAAIAHPWKSALAGPGHGLQQANGRLVIPVKISAPEGSSPRRRVGIIYSDDHGATWNPGGFVPATLGETSESTVFETAKGVLVLNSRWHDGPCRVSSESRDGGLTWSIPVAVRELPDPVCEGSILKYSADPADGRVFFSNLAPLPGGKRSRLIVRKSTDNGATWPHARVVMPGPAGYSDLAVSADGSLLVLFENGAHHYAEKMTLARLPANSWDDLEAAGMELRADRYDFIRSKEIAKAAECVPVVVEKNRRDASPAVHVFREPVTTRALLLLITGVKQTDGFVYLQEIEAWGTRIKTP